MNKSFKSKRIHSSTTNRNNGINSPENTTKKRRVNVKITTETGKVIPLENALPNLNQDAMYSLFDRMADNGSITAYACISKSCSNAVNAFFIQTIIELKRVGNILTPFNGWYNFLDNDIPTFSSFLYIYSRNFLNMPSLEMNYCTLREFQNLFTQSLKNYIEIWRKNQFDTHFLENENNQLYINLGFQTYTLDFSNAPSRLISIKLINAYISDPQIIQNYIEKDSESKNIVITIIKLAKNNQTTEDYNKIIKDLIKNIYDYYFQKNTAAIQLITHLCQENLIDKKYANQQCKKKYIENINKWVDNSFDLVITNNNDLEIFANLKDGCFKLNCINENSKNVLIMFIREYMLSRSIFRQFTTHHTEEAALLLRKSILTLVQQAKDNQSSEKYNEIIETLIRNASDEFLYNMNTSPIFLISKLSSENLIDEIHNDFIQELSILVLQQNEDPDNETHNILLAEKINMLSILTQPKLLNSFNKQYFYRLTPLLLENLSISIISKENMDENETLKHRTILSNKELITSIFQYYICQKRSNITHLNTEQYDELKKLSIQYINEAWPNQDVFAPVEILNFIIDNKLSKITEKEIQSLKVNLIQRLQSVKQNENFYSTIQLLISFIKKGLFIFKTSEINQIKESLINIITKLILSDEDLKLDLINAFEFLLEQKLIEITAIDFYTLTDNILSTTEDNSLHYHWGVGNLLTTLLKNNLIKLTEPMENELITPIIKAICENDPKLNQQHIIDLLRSITINHAQNTQKQPNWAALNLTKTKMLTILHQSNNSQEQLNALHILKYLTPALSSREQFTLKEHEARLNPEQQSNP